MTVGPTIYVYGRRMQEAILWMGYPDEETGLEPHPTLEPGGGGGTANPIEHAYSETDVCAEGTAKEIGAYIHNVLVPGAGKYEYGTYIEEREDVFGAQGNGIHTNYSDTYAKLPGLPDYSNIRGTVHNHLWNNDPAESQMNYINRYPGPEDWAGLGQLVNPGNGILGANPATLAVYITDPWGVTREFRYSDRELYEQMDNSARAMGDNLPDEVKDCP